MDGGSSVFVDTSAAAGRVREGGKGKGGGDEREIFRGRCTVSSIRL